MNLKEQASRDREINNRAMSTKKNIDLKSNLRRDI